MACSDVPLKESAPFKSFKGQRVHDLSSGAVFCLSRGIVPAYRAQITLPSVRDEVSGSLTVAETESAG